MIELLTIALATLLSEDLACISAGMLVASGRLGFIPATLACFVGIYVGDLLLYLAGRAIGSLALTRLRRRWDEPIRRGTEWLERHGAMTVFVARFARFSVYFLAAALVWTPILVGSTAFLGGSLQRFGWGAQLAAAVAFVLMLRLFASLVDRRRRRLLSGRWRRFVRWEFWPSWAAYLPVIPWMLWLAIRHRGATAFTAANPAIPASGVVGESKIAILRLLWRTHEFLPRTELVTSPDEVFTLPVVLKPDAGQRGSGVVIARTQSDVHAYFAQFPGSVVCQELVEGPELGIFYVRDPRDSHGRILSVTEKVLPSVTGDGVSTLETLILRDERAVCMAPFYLRKLGARVQEVPAAGESVQLVELGTHCRGAIFLDGRWVLTPALEEAIDRMSRAAEGFYFGRYDIRAASIEELRAGRFKVLELNGVTSEATHIYDPRVGIVAAYRALFEQWRLAFEIGAVNRSRGAATTSLLELLRRLREYRKLARLHPEPRQQPCSSSASTSSSAFSSALSS